MIAQIESIEASRPKIGFAEIEKLTHTYDTESARLEEQVAAMEEELQAVKQKWIRPLKKQASIVAASAANLYSAIESAPHLFVKPRTITINGVKVGLTTAKGKLEFEDEEKAVALIEKMFKDTAEIYLNIKKTPNKDMIRTLDAVVLKKLGAQIEGEGDVVVLKREAGDVEKLIEKLIKKLVEAMVSVED
jgi:hypothetical protein